MGNHQGSEQCLEQHYAHLMGKHMQFSSSGAKVGGAIGGYSSLEDYGNSAYSKAKEELIRGIAADVSSSLQVKSDYARTAPIKDLVEKFKRIVPDPKNKKNISSNANVHKVICLNLAKSINKRYDMNIIDVNAEPGVMCQKVSEIMYSLFAGLHSEFLTVSADVSRILKNLQILKELVDAANKKIMYDMANSGDEAVSSEAKNIQSLYEKLSAEINRQHSILANLISGVITPLGKSLITLLEENNDFHGLTEDLSKTIGTVQFGERLGYLLSGTSDIAHAAHLVDKALKEIGMSVKEYKNAENIHDLRAKIYDIMTKKRPSSSELHKMLIASDIIYRNDLAHEDIAAYLDKKSGGANDEFNVSFADDADMLTFQTDNDTPFKGRSQSYRKSISKQIFNRNLYRKQLFVTLNSQIKEKYNTIKHVIGIISKKIGSEIELTPELDLFIKQLNTFANSQPERQNLHIALSGYRKDINSRYVKHRFMQNLISLSEVCSILVSQRGGSLFKELKQSIEDLISLIDNFNDTFTKTLSEINIDLTRKSVGGEVDNSIINYDEDVIMGGKRKNKERKNNLDSDDGMNEENIYEEMEEPSEEREEQSEEREEQSEEREEQSEESEEAVGGEIQKSLGGVINNLGESQFNHYKTIKKSIREIDYFYRIAGIKKNMQSASAEFDNNTENYENILGEEAGYIIDYIQEKYNNLIRACEEDTKTPALQAEDYGKLYAHGRTVIANCNGFQNSLHSDLSLLKAGAANQDEKDQIDSALKGYKFLLEYIKSAQIEMLEAAQALDLYLSKFTKSVQLKPDQIKDFSQILEQIELVAKWFTDKSGDNLAAVFEAFDYKNANAQGIVQDFPETKIATTAAFLRANNDVYNNLDGTYRIQGQHYYDDIKASGGAVGRFYIPRILSREQAIELVKSIEKAIKSVRALENIINTFSKVNVQISEDVKTFMSSGLMFKAFMKYCVASVISVGYLSLDGTGNPALAGGNVKPSNNLNFTAAYNNTANIANAAKLAYAKMGVALRFNTDTIRWASGNPGTYLELCNPLKINNESIFKRGDFCDKIFEMCIKSISSKVFILVGTYSLFNKPAKDSRISPSLVTNPLRQILGGFEGDDVQGGLENDRVQIIPEATDLYVRLPLLAEWYRKVFEFGKSSVNDYVPPRANRQDDPLVSYVPDNDSIWGDLCRVIFLEAANIDDGSYPSEYANKIIRAVNSIFKHYRSKNKSISCREILNEFVLDINRRYGFLMRSEINRYIDEKYKYINDSEEYPEEDRVDYDLLDVDGEMGRRPAPSDRFRLQSKSSSNKKAQSLENFYRAVRRFRQSIETNLMLPPEFDDAKNQQNWQDSQFRTVADISLSGVIREVKRKLDKASDDTERYDIIREQLHGVEKFADIDQQKMLLFHETVISPLTILYFTYLLINDYNKFFVSLNIPENFNDPLYTTAVPNGLGGLAAFRVAAAALVPPRRMEEQSAVLVLRNNNKMFKGQNNPYSQNLTADLKLESMYDYKTASQYFNDNAAAAYVEQYYMTDAKATDDAAIDGGGPEARQRFLFNNSKLMETMLRKIMSVGVDMNGLTEINFAGSGSVNSYPVINFDRLESTCTKLFNSINSSLTNLRKFLPNSVIENIEVNKDSKTGLENRISLFYIQEHLFDRLFKNKYGGGLTDSSNGLRNLWKIMTKKYSFNGLNNNGVPVNNSVVANRRSAVNIAAIPNTNNVQVEAECNDFYYNSFNDVFSKLGFWDVTMQKNSISGHFGFRTLVGTNKSLQFPAMFNPIFASGSTVINTKLQNEVKTVGSMSSRITYDAKLGGLSIFNKGVANIITNAGVGTSYNLLLGVHNLYDYHDNLDKEFEYSTIATSDFHPSDIDRTPQMAAPGPIGGEIFLHDCLGLIPKFNNLIYKYVKTFMNMSSKKIYRPFLEKFVGGHNSKDILQGRNINERPIIDLIGVPGAIANGLINHGITNLETIRSAVCLTEPQKGAVLFSSLASALRTIMTSISENKFTNVGVPLYIEESFANITEYQKDLMRAYLPAFNKELNLIIKKAEFLRGCLEETQIRVYKYKLHLLVENNLQLIFMNDGDVNYTQPNVIPSQNLEENTNATRKSYLIGIYNDIITSSKSLLKCIDEVQKELGDIPLYFETYHESIIDYNNRNGRLPLMPISHITHLMNMNVHRDGPLNDVAFGGAAPDDEKKSYYDLSLITDTSSGIGANTFKFTYGTRGLLNYSQKISLDFAPGVLALLESYNSRVKSEATFDKALMTDVSTNSILLSRWILDTMYHKEVLCSHGWGRMRRLILENQQNIQNAIVAVGPIDGYVRNLTCQTGKSSSVPDTQYWSKTENVISLIESDNFKQSVYRMISCLYAQNTTNKLYGLERNKYRIYNILDLNIDPINVHALQREVPFSNLFNFSYTFDHMIKNFIGVSLKNKNLAELGENAPTDRVIGVVNSPDEYGDKSFNNDDYKDMYHVEDTFTKNIIFPLGFRRLREYVNNISHYMRGNMSHGLGRPKYLSDQLWNKVLINNTFNDYFEIGIPNISQNRELNASVRSSILDVVASRNMRQRQRLVSLNGLLYSNTDNAEPLLYGININRDSTGMINQDISRTIGYMNSNGDRNLVFAAPGASNTIQKICYEGYLRYNSRLVRWLEWMVNLQRIMRLLMRNQLEWVGDVIVESNDAISEEVTEYKNNSMFNISDFE